MKKFISSIAVLLLLAVSASNAQSMFFGSGAAGADVVITKVGGSISAENVLLSVETNATVVIYRGKVSSDATAASTGTTITIATDSTNTVNGVTLTTSDYIIVGSQLRDISGLAPTEGGLTTVITVTSAASVASGQPVYVCDDGDKVSVSARTTWANAPIPFLFRGFNNAPAAISVPAAAGATMVSGKAERL